MGTPWVKEEQAIDRVRCVPTSAWSRAGAGAVSESGLSCLLVYACAVLCDWSCECKWRVRLSLYVLSTFFSPELDQGLMLFTSPSLVCELAS